MRFVLKFKCRAFWDPWETAAALESWLHSEQTHDKNIDPLQRVIIPWRRRISITEACECAGFIKVYEIDRAIVAWTWKIVSVSVIWFISQWMNRSQHGLFVGPTFSSFNTTPAQITEKKLIGLFFRGEFCLISSSSLYKSILCIVKRTN